MIKANLGWLWWSEARTPNLTTAGFTPTALLPARTASDTPNTLFSSSADSATKCFKLATLVSTMRIMKAGTIRNRFFLLNLSIGVPITAPIGLLFRKDCLRTCQVRMLHSAFGCHPQPFSSWPCGLANTGSARRRQE